MQRKIWIHLVSSEGSSPCARLLSSNCPILPLYSSSPPRYRPVFHTGNTRPRPKEDAYVPWPNLPNRNTNTLELCSVAESARNGGELEELVSREFGLDSGWRVRVLEKSRNHVRLWDNMQVESGSAYHISAVFLTWHARWKAIPFCGMTRCVRMFAIKKSKIFQFF